jgi:hypothetical protein
MRAVELPVRSVARGSTAVATPRDCACALAARAVHSDDAMRISNILMVVALTGCAIETETDTDDLDTGEIESESSVTQWGGFYGIPNGRGGTQMSQAQVGLAEFNGLLHMVHKGNSYPNELWHATYGPGGWSGDTRLPFTSLGGPSLLVHGNALKMITRSATAQRLEMSTMVNGLFQTPGPIGTPIGSGVLNGEPVGTVFGGRIYVAYCTTNAVRVERQDGTAWSVVLQIPNGCSYVELAQLPDTGQLYLYYARTDGSIYERKSTSGLTWTNSSVLVPYKKTLKPMSIVSCNGVTHFSHGGYSNPGEVWWSERLYGSWSNDAKISYQTSYGGAAIGCYQNQAVMVHNSHNNELMYSRFIQ